MSSKTKTATLNFVIAGDARGGQKAMRSVSGEADGLAAKAKKVAGFLTAGAVVAWGRQAIQTYRTVGGEMLKIVRLTGVSDEAASGIWVGAQQSGVAVEKLSGAVAIFQSKLQKGQLDKYGLGLTDATGKALPFEESLRKIADRFAEMDDAGAKVDLARSLFGKSGTDLLPLLNKGGDALDEFIAKADEMGLSLNSDDIKEATKNQRDFQLATTSASFVIGKELLPLATRFTSWASAELPRVVGWVTSVGGAVSGLPGPLKAVLGALVLIGPAAKTLSIVATPFRIIKDLAGSARAGLDMFRLGLGGVTQQGAGAANAMGSFIATIGPVGVAAGVAGLALVAVAFTQIQMDSQRAKQNVSELQQQLEAGLSPAQAAAAKLAATLAGVDGGFSGIGGSSADFRKDLESLGVSATEAVRLISGPQKQWDEWVKDTREKDPVHNEVLIANLERMRGATTKATDAEAIRKRITKELGIETEAAADATDESTGALDDQVSALDRANSAMSDLRNKQREIYSAEQAVADTHTATRDAQEELAEAMRAARGESEEYASARQDVRDAEQSVADAQGEVVEAQRGVTEAQRDLNETRVDARERLREMAQATRDAALAEEEANLAVRESRQELERKARDPRATELEKERARLELKKAQEAARQAGEDSSSQAARNAAAQAAGVEGDREVVRAREAVAEASRQVSAAERGVADARRGVQDAEAKAAKVITDARAEVAAAVKKSEDAVVKEADAWGALAEAQRGPLAGAEAYRDFLANLNKDLDPNSPLAQRVASLLADIDRAILLGALVEHGSNVPDSVLNPPGRGGSGGGGEGHGRSGDTKIDKVEVHQHLSGTPTQQNRAAKNAATDALDQLGLGGR